MHFVPYYPSARVGGVGEFAAALHQGLLRRGVDSTVVTQGRGSQGSVHRIAASRLGWFLGTLCWARRAARCDVVHCQSGEALPVVLALRLMPRRRARILATFHVANAGILASGQPYRLEGRRFADPPSRRLPAQALAWLHRALDALVLRLADSSNAICRSTALELLGPRAGRGARVIYNGVATREPAAAAPVEPVELFYAGVASQRKRVASLPFVLRAVRRELPDARLRIAGFSFEQAPELRALFDELGQLAYVECLGPRPSAELRAHYRAAGVVVVPSAYEGLPYVILEAMREGTPVVATRVSGHPEVIEDGTNGFLVPVDDPPALAARCVELLRDRERRARMGAAARQTVERRFDRERQVDVYLDYYRELAREDA